jgi:hypothetical protein
VKRFALLTALFLAACGPIGAAQAHTLSLGFKSGDTYKYKFHATSKQTVGMSTMSMPVEVDISATESAKVNSVDSSGTADLTITLSDFTLKSVSGGVTNTTTGLPANTVDVKIRADGTLVGVNGTDLTTGSPLGAFSGLGGGFFIAAVLPDHPVKVGDTWTKDYDQTMPSDTGTVHPTGTGTVHITSSSKYLRDESVNGVSAAVVETKSNGTVDLTISGTPPGTATGIGTGSVSIHGTFTTDVTTWIDPSGHRIIKSHSTSTDDATVTLPEQTGATEQNPMMTGPITAKGQGTSDLNPA